MRIGWACLALGVLGAAPALGGEAEQLTVSLWLGQDRRVVTDWPLNEPSREVA